MRRGDSWTWSVLALMPALTIVAGSACLFLLTGDGWFKSVDLGIALLVAALAPLVTICLCRALRPKVDFVLLGTGFMLTSIGMVCLLGLAPSSGVDRAFYVSVVVRQGLFVGIGCGALVAGLLTVDRLDVIMRYPYSMAIAALGLTAVTIVAGVSVNGARLWLNVGPVRFQPSEIARVLVAGFVAAYLFERRHLVASPWRLGSLDLPPAPYLIPLGATVVIAAALLALQNDLGMAALLTLGMAAATVGALRSRLTAGIVVLLMAAAMAAAFAFTPRVQDRVAGWINPWHVAATAGYQLIQADYALAAGGLFGPGVEVRATVVPEVHTDFILAAIGSQFGILTVIAVLVLSAVVVLRCVVNALRAANGFGMLLGGCLAVLLALQLILITGGSLHTIPLTGVTFPLVSYGGTSMIATLFAIGLVAGIGADGGSAARHREQPSSVSSA
jgi:cell division protein FtsW (lipid II flippase)